MTQNPLDEYKKQTYDKTIQKLKQKQEAKKTPLQELLTKSTNQPIQKGSMSLLHKPSEEREDRMVDQGCRTMTPEEEQALQEHVQGIAKILYRNTPAEQLKNLAGIEQAVREQMQKHVMPEVGVF